ncbi:hypothetical protein R3P38DRAFT_3337434 [Favolaschia claudopus]|uniref:Uncharacterized protein n=1 Tax=Favolaschia claudopus TaxID=2862362 RepID=A0AAV9Z269_9AGAR
MASSLWSVEPDESIEYRNGQLHHVFHCAARNCRHTVSRNQTTKDAKSTKNLRSHAVKCCGEDNVAAALQVSTKRRHSDQRLTDLFKAHAAAGGESFSHVPLTREQTRVEHVRWISESLRPFTVVQDRGYRRLMKSGRPSTYIPSLRTVARDVKILFDKTRERLRKRFEVCLLL